VAWYPAAIKKNIAPGKNDPKIRVRGIINHIRAGLGDSLFDVFQSRGGIESHFYIRNSGIVEQYRDTDYEADAQTDGNSFIIDGVRWGHISIEHEGKDGDLLTPQQLEADKKLFLWIHSTHGVPLQRLPDWNGRGVGWHCQYPEFNPLRKTCPTRKRIDQIITVLEPWYLVALKPSTAVVASTVSAKNLESDMRVIVISSDKAPQRQFFLAGDRATYVRTPAISAELRKVTGQTEIPGLSETTMRTFYPATDPVLTKLGQVYDQMKAQGAELDAIIKAQAEAAKEFK